MIVYRSGYQDLYGYWAINSTMPISIRFVPEDEDVDLREELYDLWDQFDALVEELSDEA